MISKKAKEPFLEALLTFLEPLGWVLCCPAKKKLQFFFSVGKVMSYPSRGKVVLGHDWEGEMQDGKASMSFEVGKRTPRGLETTYKEGQVVCSHALLDQFADRLRTEVNK